jgi:hypothetical protein
MPALWQLFNIRHSDIGPAQENLILPALRLAKKIF